MKYLKMFEAFKQEFKVTKIEVSPEDSPGNVEAHIEWSTEKKLLELPETEFIDYIKKGNEGLARYIDSLKDESPELILGDLQEIGVDLKEILQKYVDENVDHDSFGKLKDPDEISDADMRNIFGIGDDDEGGDVGLMDPDDDPDFK